MNKEEIALITQSWSQILTAYEEVGETFYKRLFELDPELRNLFQTDITEQSRKFVSMITFIIFKLDSLEEVLQQARELGTRHLTYYVTLKDFDTVKQAFFETLETNGTGMWNAQLQAVWAKAYDLLEKAMKEGYGITS